MSMALLRQAEEFAYKSVPARLFADQFMKDWKRERDEKALLEDPRDLSEALSSIFCVADLYNPDDDREPYEFSEERLRNEVRQLVGALRS